MTVVVWIFALVAAAIHILVFVWESLLIGRPSVHEGIFSVSAADLPAIRLWAFNVGFYNLFLGCGLIAGVATWASGYRWLAEPLSSTCACLCFSPASPSSSPTAWR